MNSVIGNGRWTTKHESFLLAGIGVLSALGMWAVGIIGPTVEKSTDYVSADGRFHVSVTEHLGTPKTHLFENYGTQSVSFRAVDSHQGEVVEGSLYEGDGLDDRFWNLYPEGIWLTPSTLAFGGSWIARPHARVFHLILSNHSGADLDYVLLNFEKTLKVLNLHLDRDSVCELALPSEARTETMTVYYRSRKGTGILNEKDLKQVQSDAIRVDLNAQDALIGPDKLK